MVMQGARVCHNLYFYPLYRNGNDKNAVSVVEWYALHKAEGGGHPHK